MKLNYVVNALNAYLLKKYPNAKGWFIGKEHMEPALVNAYKKIKVEIYYHLPGKNHLAFTVQLVDRCLEGTEDILKEKVSVELLTLIFTNFYKIDEYATI